MVTVLYVAFSFFATSKWLNFLVFPLQTLQPPAVKNSHSIPPERNHPSTLTHVTWRSSRSVVSVMQDRCFHDIVGSQLQGLYTMRWSRTYSHDCNAEALRCHSTSFPPKMLFECSLFQKYNNKESFKEILHGFRNSFIKYFRSWEYLIYYLLFCYSVCLYFLYLFSPNLPYFVLFYLRHC